MGPAACNRKAGRFFFRGMAGLVAVCNAYPLETCQELYTKPLDVPFNEYSIEAAFDHRGEQLLITGYSYPKEQLGYLFTTGEEEKSLCQFPSKMRAI